jgi:hypothetical protein
MSGNIQHFDLPGCGRTGTPDRNDWISDCAAQAQIEALLRQAIAVLGDPGANR